MKVIDKSGFMENKAEMLQKIKEGAVFIYPTDTSYGIGCDATNEIAVRKIRDIKNRPKSPFSVIAPSKDWIREKCRIDPERADWLDVLPGKYTLILNLKKSDAVTDNVVLDRINRKTLGVRIPGNWFSAIVEELGFPVVTTLAGFTGESHMTDLEDLHEDIKKNVDFIVYEGEKKKSPSDVVRLDYDEITVSKRI